jgi:hypothetical protein
VFEDSAEGVLIAHEGEDAHALATVEANERILPKTRELATDRSAEVQAESGHVAFAAGIAYRFGSAR